MQALLSYDQSPPIEAHFRYFQTAPVFGTLAGVLLVWTGPGAFLSRWTPEALALTHLITAGFMLQVMLGALIQVLPVVAGANMARPQLISRFVHGAITLGAGLLASAFLTFRPWLFIVSGLCFIVGGLLFVGAAAWAMRGVSATGPTITGLKTSVSGFCVTVALGAAMAFGMAGWFDLPLIQLADIHLGWGVVVWGIGLLAAVAYVVVPMFQITPAYPAWLANWFARFSLAATGVWTVVAITGPDAAYLIAALAMVGAAAVFFGVTLSLQRRSKRSRFDTNQYCWCGAMASMLAAAAIWATANTLPAVGEWPGWPTLCGVLLLFGGFVLVITGMLYKIVPFLVWLHLQNLGGGVRMTPNMKKIIDETSMHRQMLSHFVAVILLLVAVLRPEEMAVPAGVAVVVSQSWLAWNLWSGVRVFRNYRNRILEKLAVS
ncbi:MAG: hypothetical protein QMB52_00495 [Propionivibrio sp.]